MSSEEILVRRFREHIRRTSALLPAQEDAVFSDAPLTLVGAGAGTGKTHTLAWRFIRCLLREDVRPRDILTLTFTEKAAAEMEDRITRLFTELRPALDPKGTLLAAAAEELQEATISTIHSFALSMVREQALFLPSGLSARAMTPPEEELFVRRATNALDTMDMEWFRRSLPQGQTPGAFLGESLRDLPDILNAYEPKRVMDYAMALSDTMESRGGGPAGLAESAADEGFVRQVTEKIEAVCRPEAAQVTRLWLGHVLPGLPADGKVNERVEALRAKWCRQRPGEDRDADLEFAWDLYRELLGDLRRVGKSTKERIEELLGSSLTDYREPRSALWDGLCFLDRGFLPEDLRLRAVLLRTAAMIWEAFREFRRRRALLSFDDMIRLARDASRPGESGGPPLYREVLVDEFQDTSPLQEGLIRSVAAPEAHLFFVGDVKQSIYRFRHADPTLFGDLIEGRGDAVAYIPLQSNFRTRAALLREVNGLFGALWADGVSSTLRQSYEDLLFPDDGDLRSRREETSLPPVTRLFVAQTEGEKLEDTRRRVARALAGQLAAFRGQPVWDKGRRDFRPAKWRDMAILVPSRTSFAALEKVLAPEFGIPAVFDRGKQYFARGETADLLAAVRAIACPEDRTALLAFLASPFSGLSVEEALSLADPGKDPVDSRFPRALSKLERLRTTAVCGGMYRALLLLLKDRSFLLHTPFWGRRVALANLWKGLDMVREYEASFGVDPAGCAAYLSAMASLAGGVEEASALSEDEDIVRVLTIHSSKGLEFPIVAVVDLDKKPGGRDSETLVPSPLLGAGVSSYPKGWSDGEGGMKGLASFLEDRELREEWERLFYVACTRARDSLVLCSPCKVKDGALAPTEGSWLALLEPLTTVEPPPAAPLPRSGEKGDVGGHPVVPGPDLSQVALRRLSATSYALFRWCPAAWRMKYRQGLPLAWELPSEDGPGGADLGSLAHWVLARWSFRPDEAEALIAPEHPPVYLPGDLRPVWRDKESRRALAGWLAALAASPLGEVLARKRDEGALLRESPFRIADGDLLLTGSMDVVWEEGGTVFIRDYKITAADLEDRRPWEPLYAAQLAFYGYAASKLWKGRGQDIRLVHLREGREGAPLDPDVSHGETGRLIKETAQLAAQGPFPPLRERCPGCFYRFDCPHSGSIRGSSSS